MARNVNSETGVNVNSRESPLLLRYVHGVHRPAMRETRNFRDENFRYRFLKWTALSVSTLFVVNIKVWWRMKNIPLYIVLWTYQMIFLRTKEIIGSLTWLKRRNKPLTSRKIYCLAGKVGNLAVRAELIDTTKISLHRRCNILCVFFSPHNIHATGLSRHLHHIY